jgi:hypothetical protein
MRTNGGETTKYAKDTKIKSERQKVLGEKNQEKLAMSRSAIADLFFCHRPFCLDLCLSYDEPSISLCAAQNVNPGKEATD